MMKTKAAKNMRGLMCHSAGATAVCMATEPLSVIVQRKSLDRNLTEHARLINNAKYIRLGEAHRLTTRIQRSTTVPSLTVKSDQEETSKAANSSVAVKDQVFQVVVMRVSLHCQGCAGKVKKHLSKMEGVTSFSIDLESKRVTVRGHISPNGVLESLSKVKRAELWPC